MMARKRKASLKWLISQPVRGGRRDLQPKRMAHLSDLNGGEIIALALRANGLGQKQVAKRIGVHHGNYRNWLKRNGLETNTGSGLCNKTVAWGNYVALEIEAHGRVERTYAKSLNLWKVRSWKERNPLGYEVYKEKQKRRLRETYRDRKADIVWNLKKTVRSRVANALRRRYVIKEVKTIELLGINWEGYVEYLQTKLSDGMTFENFGNVWHIDHIKPLNTFDLRNLDEAKMAFHWSNTRPMFAHENLSRPKDGSDCEMAKMAWKQGEGWAPV